MKKYGYSIGAIICLYIAVAVGQDFIKLPKIKKVYVSCQQYLELAGDVIARTNSFWGICADLSKKAFAIQKESLDTVNSHIDGDKNCFLQQADKVERTNKYTKLMKIKNELDRCIEGLYAMEQRLEALVDDFNKETVVSAFQIE